MALLTPPGLVAQGLAPVRGGELAYGEAPGLGSLNPYQSLVRNGPTDRVLSMIYEPLFRYNFNEDQWEPVLATKATPVAARNNKATSAFLVELKSGVVWHDGTPFGANDVVFTYEYLKAAAANLQVKQSWNDMLVEVRRGTSPLQVIFEFRRQVSDARLVLLDFILPAARFLRPSFMPSPPEADLNRSPLGTGPYKFDRFDEGYPILSVNEKYHGTRGYLDRVRAREYSDQATMVETLLSDPSDISMIVEMPGESIARVEANRGVQTGQVESYNVWAIAMRQKRGSPLVNEAFRRALTMAVDREQIRKVWFAGRGQVLAGPVTPNANFFDPTIQRIKYDQAQARKDIEATGLKPQRPLVFAYPAAELAMETRSANIVRSVKEALEAVGIAVTERPIKGSREYQALLFGAGDFDLALVRWEFNPAYDIAPIFHSSNAKPGGYNFMNFSDPEVDRLLDEYDGASDDARRQGLMKQAQRIIAQRAPAIFLVNDEKIYAYKNRVRVPDGMVDPFYFFTYVNAWWISNR